MNILKLRILSWLLHHANKEGRNGNFYEIKAALLSKYGKYIADDIQFIEGKKCFSCGGSGTYIGYSWHTYKSYESECFKCDGTGWFKLPTYVILKRIQFGKYCFHQPWKRAYFKNPIPSAPVIEGYVEHIPSKYSEISRDILFFLYDRKYWIDILGSGWYNHKQYKPKILLHNLLHLIKYNKNAIPISRLRRKLQKSNKNNVIQYNNSSDDLPF